MKYFSPETSKKLEEIGLKASPIGWIASAEGAMDAIAISQKTLHTLDICEIENAKKLWGEEDKELEEINSKEFLGMEWTKAHNQEMNMWMAMTFGEKRNAAAKRWSEKTNPYNLTTDEWRIRAESGSNVRLHHYITLSDEERVKYVEDYLNMV